MIKACIFDLDGVLVDTAKYHFQSWKRLAKKLDFSIPDDIEESLKGISRMDSLDIILGVGNIEATEAEKIEYATLKNDWYLDSISVMKRHETLPGVVKMLDTLASNNIKISVGSASKNAKSILTKIELIDRFETVIDGNMVEKTKPNPEVFLKAADAMDINPVETIVFEDSSKGITAAKRGGFRTVGIGKQANLAEAELVINGFDGYDILHIVEQFSQNNIHI